jgi:hypothetical protein
MPFSSRSDRLSQMSAGEIEQLHATISIDCPSCCAVETFGIMGIISVCCVKCEIVSPRFECFVLVSSHFECLALFLMISNVILRFHDIRREGVSFDESNILRSNNHRGSETLRAVSCDFGHAHGLRMKQLQVGRKARRTYSEFYLSMKLPNCHDVISESTLHHVQ